MLALLKFGMTIFTLNKCESPHCAECPDQTTIQKTPWYLVDWGYGFWEIRALDELLEGSVPSFSAGR